MDYLPHVVHAFEEKGIIIRSVSKASSCISGAGPYDAITKGLRCGVYNTRRGLNKYASYITLKILDTWLLNDKVLLVVTPKIVILLDWGAATFMVEIGVRVFARCVIPSKMTSAFSGMRTRSLWQNQIWSSDRHSSSLDSSVLDLFGVLRSLCRDVYHRHTAADWDRRLRQSELFDISIQRKGPVRVGNVEDWRWYN